MDEHDDGDYKYIIQKAGRLGAVVIAIVGPEKNPKDGTNIEWASGGLYEQELDRLFEQQPQLNPFRKHSMFFSFLDKLNPQQAQRMVQILHLGNYKSLPKLHINGGCVVF
uniref:Uncharacterized protein n=1 Tax=Eutreptiella gymnastica TaxID=73025 RepID=A0A7S1NIN1_9EUGL|mmetsp:Transcript_41348/g.74196  ORF Transcript_41348/g.74196 Transcript_41348/m.74196 type:complete len:110 (+) Transcript_41348:114-443(+)